MKEFQEIDLEKVGERIRNTRKKLNLMQEMAAEEINLSNQFWSRLESGHERASISTYRRITAAIGLTRSNIFYDDVTRIRLHKVFTKEGVLEGCTAPERAIISEMKFAMKGVLERNRKE